MMTTMTLNKNKVLLGLSGGVDSTTAALFLQKKGFDVTGFYFEVIGDKSEGAEDAKKVADELGIPLITFDASKKFRDIVIENFLSSYKIGKTPNPCVLCNPEIKFKLLLEHADKIGAYYIATGHYARIFHNLSTEKYFVQRGINEKKDQSYMLYRLGQDVLSRLIFPLGMSKDKGEVREIAYENHLSNAGKADSQEICFLQDDTDYINYINEHGYSAPQGNFIDKNGNVLGTHKGIHCYTIGQRKGLGIALGKPVFVTNIDPKTNNITLGGSDDLMKFEIHSYDNFFTETGSDSIPSTIGENFSCYAKIRYASQLAKAHVTKEQDNKLKIHFEQPQRAPSPGQSIVFYDRDIVIGGGYIDNSY